MSTVDQLRMHAGASDTHIPRPLLNRAADEIDALRAHREALIGLASGFMPESNHAMFTDAANALLTRSTDRRE